MSKPYPIAEEFDSIQGEGLHAGTWMHFVRLAGCSVGDVQHGIDEMSPRVYCHTPCGKQFRCDTDFRARYTATIEELVQRTETVEHVCLTGGEPFLYDLKPLVNALFEAGNNVHIETSGTRPIDLDIANMCWVTISPKAKVLTENIQHAAEVKYLVSEDTEQPEIEYLEKLVGEGTGFDGTVYIQPINYRANIDQSSLNKALEIIKTHPQWRLSVQLHKLISMK
jgi:7-carboxy-7-deazaguanine synthase